MASADLEGYIRGRVAGVRASLSLKSLTLLLTAVMKDLAALSVICVVVLSVLHITQGAFLQGQGVFIMQFSPI